MRGTHSERKLGTFFFLLNRIKFLKTCKMTRKKISEKKSNLKKSNKTLKKEPGLCYLTTR